MAMRDVVLCRDLARPDQRMSRADHADEVVAEQRLHAYFRTHGVQHADLQVGFARAQRRGGLLRLGREAQLHARRHVRDGGDQARAEGLDEAVVGAEGEHALQRGQVERRRRRLQHGARVLDRGARTVAERFGIGREHHLPASAHQQRIAGGVAQPGERATHRRGAQAQPARGAGDAAAGQQRVQGDQQVEVGGGHGVRRRVGDACMPCTLSMPAVRLPHAWGRP